MMDRRENIGPFILDENQKSLLYDISDAVKDRKGRKGRLTHSYTLFLILKPKNLDALIEIVQKRVDEA